MCTSQRWCWVTPTPLGGPVGGLALTGTRTGWVSFGGSLLTFDGGALTLLPSPGRVAAFTVNDAGILWRDFSGQLYANFTNPQPVTSTITTPELRGGEGTHWLVGFVPGGEAVGTYSASTSAVLAYPPIASFGCEYAFRGSNEALAYCGGGFTNRCDVARSVGGAFSTYLSITQSGALFMACSLHGAGADTFLASQWFAISSSGSAIQRILADGGLAAATIPGRLLIAPDGRVFALDGGVLLAGTGTAFTQRATGLPAMSPTHFDERGGALAFAEGSQLWVPGPTPGGLVGALRSVFPAAQQGGAIVPAVVAGAPVVATKANLWRFVDGGLGGATAHAGFPVSTLIDWNGRPWGVSSDTMGYLDVASSSVSPTLGAVRAVFGDALGTPTGIVVTANIYDGTGGTTASGTVLARSTNGSTFTRIGGIVTRADGGAGASQFDGGLAMSNTFFDNAALAGTSVNDFYVTAVGGRLLHVQTLGIVEHTPANPPTDLCNGPQGAVWGVTGAGFGPWNGSSFGTTYAGGGLDRIVCSSTQVLAYSTGQPLVVVHNGTSATVLEPPIVPRRCAILPSGEVLCAGRNDDVVVWRP